MKTSEANILNQKPVFYGFRGKPTFQATKLSRFRLLISRYRTSQDYFVTADNLSITIGELREVFVASLYYLHGQRYVRI